MVFTNEFLMGLGYGWVAPTLRSLQNTDNGEFSLDTTQCSWVASLHDFGRMFGPFLGGLLLDTAGRKFILAVCSVIFFLMWLLILFTKSVPVIYLIRLTFGIGVGMNDVTSTIYLGENCHPQLRGIFGGISVAFFYLGQLVEFILAAYSSYNTVAIVNASAGLFALGTILVSFETAQYLIIKGKYELAFQNFCWLRGSDDKTNGIHDEFGKLRQEVKTEWERKFTLCSLLTAPLQCKAVTVILVFCFLTMGTGFAAVSAFASLTFTEGVFTPNEFTILYGLLQFTTVITSLFVIEKLDRKTILAFAFSVSALVHSCTAFLFYVHTFTSVPFFSWCIFSTITLYSMTYSMGILPVFFIIRGELLPQNVKAIGGSLAIMVHSLVGFLTAKAFLLVAGVYGVYINFIFFAVISFAGVLFVYFVLPETRGKSLIEIQRTVMKSK